MKNKIPGSFHPGVRLYVAVLLLFAAASAFFNVYLALAEGAVAVLMLVYYIISGNRRRKEAMEYIESITYNTQSATSSTMFTIPFPLAIFHPESGMIVWANRLFWELCGKDAPMLEACIFDLCPGFNSKWLQEGKTRRPDPIECSGRRYYVHGNLVHSNEKESTYLAATYWQDITDYEDLKREYNNSRPVEMVIIVDNYDELMKPLSERLRSEMRSKLDAEVERWCEGRGGQMRSLDRDRYIYIFEKRYLSDIVAGRFSLLESIRSIVSTNGVKATVSIGVGIDGDSFEETFAFAQLAADMALSRGGDQAVVKNKYNFEFYGGRSTEIETRTKVKSRVMASSLSRLIEAASTVYIMGHHYSDMDSIGAAAGIGCLARKLNKPFRIVVSTPNAAEELITNLRALHEYENAFITGKQAVIDLDKDALLVVVDTNRPEQVDDRSLLETCKHIAVIDHHRRAATYISNAVMTLSEPYASSACELVSEMMEELLKPEDILPGEADAVLSGIVLDTKHFTIRTGERTFDAAAFLRRNGADTTHVKLLLQNNMEDMIHRYDVVRSARVYRGIAVAPSENAQSRVVAAQAADELLNVTGVTASVVMSPTAEGGVDVSARSIGDVNVQMLLEALGGGGNHAAAGAQMKDITLKDAVKRLYDAIDDYLSTEKM